MENGLWTFDAKTQMTERTVSGPGWTSFLTGVEASKHGVINNYTYPDKEEYRTFLWRGKNEFDLETLAIISWDDFFDDIIEQDAYTLGRMPAGSNIYEEDKFHKEIEEETTKWLESDIVNGDYQMIFYYFESTDNVGHAYGYTPESNEYRDTLESIDAKLTRILNALERRSTR